MAALHRLPRQQREAGLVLVEERPPADREGKQDQGRQQRRQQRRRTTPAQITPA
jgi:hypothetical protein